MDGGQPCGSAGLVEVADWDALCEPHKADTDQFIEDHRYCPVSPNTSMYGRCPQITEAATVRWKAVLLFDWTLWKKWSSVCNCFTKQCQGCRSARLLIISLCCKYGSIETSQTFTHWGIITVSCFFFNFTIVSITPNITADSFGLIILFLSRSLKL